MLSCSSPVRAYWAEYRYNIIVAVWGRGFELWLLKAQKNWISSILSVTGWQLCTVISTYAISSLCMILARDNYLHTVCCLTYTNQHSVMCSDYKCTEDILVLLDWWQCWEEFNPKRFPKFRSRESLWPKSVSRSSLAPISKSAHRSMSVSNYE